MSHTRNETSSTIDLIIDYTMAPLSGTGKAVSGLFYSTVNAILHPLEDVVYPITQLAADAIVINMAHSEFDGLYLPSSSAEQFRHIMGHYPQIYTEAVGRMNERFQLLEAVVKEGTKEFKAANGPRRVEMATTGIASFFLPGYAVKAAKLAKNHIQLGTFHTPPQFSNVIFQDLIDPVPPFKRYTVRGIRSLTAEAEKLKYLSHIQSLLNPLEGNSLKAMGHVDTAHLFKLPIPDGDLITTNPMQFSALPTSGSKNFRARINQQAIENIRSSMTEGEFKLKYVISPKDGLVITDQYFGRSYLSTQGVPIKHIAHPLLADMRKVYAAGDLTVTNGKITYIDNKSGHYYPNGEHMGELVERVFRKYGFSEVNDLYFDVNKFEVPIGIIPVMIPNLNPSKAVVTHTKPNYLPSLKGLAAGVGLNALSTNKDELELPTFIQQAKASEPETSDAISDMEDMNEMIIEKEEGEVETGINNNSELKDETSSGFQQDIVTLYKAQASFSELIGLGIMFGSDELTKTGIIGANFIKINNALTELGVVVSPLSDALSLVAPAHPYLAFISAAAQIGLALFGRRKTDPMALAQMKQMQALLEGLYQIRNEMHRRFDRTDQSIAQLFAALDQVYYSLRDQAQANHDLNLRNIDYTAKALGEKTDHWGKVITSLVKNTHLDELDKLLIAINRYKEERIAEDRGENLASLQKTHSELANIWLLKNLIGPTYNDYVYSSDSTEQDRMYVCDGVMPESALGYLLRYATHNLKLASQLADIDARKLPSVDVWSHAIQALITAQLLSVQQHGHELPYAKSFAELQGVADNTILMVETLTEHAMLLFTELAKQYKDAQVKLLENFKLQLNSKLKSNDRYYSLKHAIDNKWIDLITLSPLINDNFVAKITSYPLAQELRLPLIFKLSQNASLITLTPTSKLTRYAASAGWKNNAGCNRRRSGLEEKGLGVDYKFELSLPQDDALFSLFSVHSSIPQTHKVECHHNDDYPTLESNAIDNANNLNKASDVSLIAASTFQSLNININIRTTLNDQFLDKVVEVILNDKTSGKNLSDEVEVIYSKAISEFLLDRATSAQSIDAMKVIEQLMRAYADLLGLPKTVDEAISLNLNSDPTALLRTPNLIKSTPQQLEAILTVIKKSLPDRNSRIISKMRAVKDSLYGYSRLMTQYNRYQDELAAWTSEVQSLNQLSQQYTYMQAMCTDQALSICEPETMPSISTGIDRHFKLLNMLRADILSRHDLLTNRGFNVTKPRTIDSIVESMPKLEINASQLDPEFDDEEMTGYSLEKTALLIEDAQAKMAAISRMNAPAHLIYGQSGRGKSTLTNVAIADVNYEKYKDSTGNILVRPKNGEYEIAKTGNDESVTVFPEFYAADTACHVDFPGSKDTNGVETQISHALMIPQAASKFTVLKIFEVVMSSADIYDRRYQLVEEVLGKVAAIIEHDPNRLINNILITISIPDEGRLEKDGVLVYEQEVLAHLQKWLSLSKQSWFKGDSIRATKHVNYPLARLISQLTLQNIIVVDVTKADHRSRYRERLTQFPESKMQDFNFKNMDKEAKGFKQFINDFDAHANALQSKRDETVVVLGEHWKASSTQILKNHAISWPPFDTAHHSLVSLLEKINQPFRSQPELNYEITGNVPHLVQAIIRDTGRLKSIKPMINRLTNIVKSLEEISSSDMRVEQPPTISRSESEPNFPISPVCYFLPAAEIAQLICDQQASFSEIAQSKPSTQSSTFFTLPGAQALPDYQSNASEQLALLRWVTHYVSKWLWGEDGLPLTASERSELRKTGKNLKSWEDEVTLLKNDMEGFSELFQHQLTWLDIRRREVSSIVVSALKNNQITSGDLSTVKKTTARMKEMIVELRNHSNTLYEWAKQPQASLPCGNVTVINYDCINHQIKKRSVSVLSVPLQHHTLFRQPYVPMHVERRHDPAPAPQTLLRLR